MPSLIIPNCFDKRLLSSAGSERQRVAIYRLRRALEWLKNVLAAQQVRDSPTIRHQSPRLGLQIRAMTDSARQYLQA